MNWTCASRAEGVFNIFWTSYVRSSYALSPGGTLFRFLSIFLSILQQLSKVLRRSVKVVRQQVCPQLPVFLPFPKQFLPFLKCSNFRCLIFFCWTDWKYLFWNSNWENKILFFCLDVSGVIEQNKINFRGVFGNLPTSKIERFAKVVNGC